MKFLVFIIIILFIHFNFILSSRESQVLLSNKEIREVLKCFGDLNLEEGCVICRYITQKIYKVLDISAMCPDIVETKLMYEREREWKPDPQVINKWTVLYNLQKDYLKRIKPNIDGIKNYQDVLNQKIIKEKQEKENLQNLIQFQNKVNSDLRKPDEVKNNAFDTDERKCDDEELKYKNNKIIAPSKNDQENNNNNQSNKNANGSSKNDQESNYNNQSNKNANRNSQNYQESNSNNQSNNNANRSSQNDQENSSDKKENELNNLVKKNNNNNKYSNYNENNNEKNGNYNKNKNTMNRNSDEENYNTKNAGPNLEDSNGKPKLISLNKKIFNDFKKNRNGNDSKNDSSNNNASANTYVNNDVDNITDQTSQANKKLNNLNKNKLKMAMDSFKKMDSRTNNDSSNGIPSITKTLDDSNINKLKSIMDSFKNDNDSSKETSKADNKYNKLGDKNINKLKSMMQSFFKKDDKSAFKFMEKKLNIQNDFPIEVPKMKNINEFKKETEGLNENAEVIDVDLTKSGAKSSIDFQKIIENMKLNEGEEIQYLGTSIGSPYEVDSKSPDYEKFNLKSLNRNRVIKTKKSNKFQQQKKFRNLNVNQGNLINLKNNMRNKDKIIKQKFENFNNENNNKESQDDYLNPDDSNQIDKEKLKEQAENLDKKIKVKSIFDIQQMNLEQNKLKWNSFNQTEPIFKNSTNQINTKTINETNDISKKSDFLMFSEINENKNVQNGESFQNNNFLYNKSPLKNLDNTINAQNLNNDLNKDSLKGDLKNNNNQEIVNLQNKNENVIKNVNMFNQIDNQIPLNNLNRNPYDKLNKYTPQINTNKLSSNSIQSPIQITDIQSLYNNNNPQSKVNKINNNMSLNEINFSNTRDNGPFENQNNNLSNVINNNVVPYSQFQNKVMNPNLNLNSSYDNNPNIQISNNLPSQTNSNKIRENQAINQNFGFNSNNYKNSNFQNPKLDDFPPHIFSNEIRENQTINPNFSLDPNNNKNRNNQNQIINDMLPPIFSNKIRENQNIIPIQKANQNTQFKNPSINQNLLESNLELKEDNPINKEIKNRLEKIKQLEMLNSSIGFNEKSNVDESIIENFENDHTNFKNIESRIANPPPSFLELEDNLRMDTNFFETLMKQSENFNLETQRRGRRRSRFPDPQWDCAETQIAKLVRYLCEEEVSSSYQKYCKPIFEQINTMIESFLYHDNNLEICQNLHMCPVSVDL